MKVRELARAEPPEHVSKTKGRPWSLRMPERKGPGGEVSDQVQRLQHDPTDQHLAPGRSDNALRLGDQAPDLDRHASSDRPLLAALVGGHDRPRASAP